MYCTYPLYDTSNAIKDARLDFYDMAGIQTKQKNIRVVAQQ